MAGVFRKTMVYLGLLEHPDDEYDDGVLDDEYAEPTVRTTRGDDVRAVRRSFDSGRDAQTAGALAIDTDRRLRLDDEDYVRRVEAPAAPSYRITTLQPANYNDAREIGEHFREGVPVIMNVSEMDERDAKRLVDFAAGLTFGLRGRIERVTNKVFLLSPSNVEVSAEDKAAIREGGFFNQS